MGINQRDKGASGWSFSRVCVTMHGSENVKSYVICNKKCCGRWLKPHYLQRFLKHANHGHF
jgi:hypothetical protein